MRSHWTVAANNIDKVTVGVCCLLFYEWLLRVFSGWEQREMSVFVILYSWGAVVFVHHVVVRYKCRDGGNDDVCSCFVTERQSSIVVRWWAVGTKFTENKKKKTDIVFIVVVEWQLRWCCWWSCWGLSVTHHHFIIIIIEWRLRWCCWWSCWGLSVTHHHHHYFIIIIIEWELRWCCWWSCWGLSVTHHHHHHHHWMTAQMTLLMKLLRSISHSSLSSSFHLQ